MTNNLDLEVRELQLQNQKLIRAVDEIQKLLTEKKSVLARWLWKPKVCALYRWAFVLHSFGHISMG